MTDRELIQKTIDEGSHEAFAEIVSRYSGMVFSKSLSLVKREELAAEVAQQTFVKAFDRLEYFNGSQLGPWLVTIAYHAAVDVLNKEKRRRAIPVEQAGAIPESQYNEEKEQKLQCLEAAIASLPPDDQQIIRLHYYEECSTKEISKRMNLSQANVLVRLHRIRERLKKMLSNGTDK